MKKKIIYVLCILGVLLALLGLKKRNDTMYSSGVYHLNRSGIVESIENNNIVVRLDKLNEQDEDFKNVNTLQLDCRNCSYELENLKEGTKIIFYYFPYNADVRPLKVENIYVINEKESNIDLMKKAGQLLDPYRDKTDESIYARGKSGGVITTKDIEQATEFYILAGYEQSDAEDKAVEYMLQRDATYQRAIAAGYSVSDDEINALKEDASKVEEMRNELKQDAVNSVKATFIIDALAKAESVEVSDQEVMQVLYYEAMQMGQNPQEIVKQYQEAGYLPAIKMSMIEEKVISKLLDEKLGK